MEKQSKAVIPINMMMVVFIRRDDRSPVSSASGRSQITSGNFTDEQYSHYIYSQHRFCNRFQYILTDQVLHSHSIRSSSRPVLLNVHKQVQGIPRLQGAH
jgi:hypothetical protein